MPPPLTVPPKPTVEKLEEVMVSPAVDMTPTVELKRQKY